MGYAANTRVILYSNPYHNFCINGAYHYWFDEYSYSLYTEEKHNPSSLLLQQDSKIIFHNLDILNLIPCELDIALTPFLDTKILTYEMSYLLLEKMVLIY